MTEFKGTKGKWELCKTYDEMDKPSFYLTSDEGKIAHCYNLQLCCGVQERANANALLISKAPEMLDLLEQIVGHHKNIGIHNWITEEAEKLIKSATEL